MMRTIGVITALVIAGGAALFFLLSW
jgi:hypothetical protein